ncbi:MAG: hypothetical protein JXB05_29160 [Myxococcaceae bacterium]|nr:hypothetical protein [Myxococcaceae bacterium]
MALDTLASKEDRGLPSTEAAARLQKHGPDVLQRSRGPSLLSLVWRQINNPIVGDNPVTRSRRRRGWSHTPGASGVASARVRGERAGRDEATATQPGRISQEEKEDGL